eukprot:TRINITY_DN5164_c0_g1_i2.p1 TRINITY_DN5164_c0_g1~~TRINITY_DN5164_c0_g1_i2.p1  ORF type:complete len:238 (+),score=40.53 TRINITY_DN5164_c0_g1_i2:69-782(+)
MAKSFEPKLVLDIFGKIILDNDKDSSLFFESIENFNEENINSIVNDTGLPPLLLLCERIDDNKEMYKRGIKELLKNESLNINITTEEDGYNALFFLADYDIAEILIEKGINVNHIALDGSCCLHHAVILNYIDLIELYIINKCNVNCYDDSYRTPLLYATHDHYKNAVELLIDNGADINSVNENGDTLLHIVYGKHDGKLLTELLLSQENIDLNIKNNKGQLYNERECEKIHQYNII